MATDLDADRTVLALEERAGRPFRELASLRSPRDKSAARRIIDDLVGRSSDVCVRTVPLRVDRRPREPTKVVGINLSAVVSTPFEQSRCRQLLDRVVFVPIVKPTTDDVGGWTIEAPFTWNPDDQELQALAADYREVRSIVREGRADDLSSSRAHGQGEIMTVKTSGRDSTDLVAYADASGTTRSARRRAFFLRSEFTSQLISQRWSKTPTVSDNMATILRLLGGR